LLGADRVLATNAVGSLRLDLEPGALIAFDDFIDFTHGRGVSFWKNHPESPLGVTHTDFSEPYCPLLRDVLMETAANLNLPLLPRATYVCANGPRFESPAEIRMFAQWGGDVVGMTGLPEAVFAREAGLCYAAVGIVTNFAAGLTPEPVDHAEVVARMGLQVEQVRALLLEAALRLPDARCEMCRATSFLPAGSDRPPAVP
jgi:Purine nucleoside phosphorylase